MAFPPAKDFHTMQDTGLFIGQHVWVDDSLRRDIECVVRGFNSLGEPILEGVDGPLRYKGSDRRVLDYPRHEVCTVKPLPSLFNAACEVVRLGKGFYLNTPDWPHFREALNILARVIERDSLPF